MKKKKLKKKKKKKHKKKKKMKKKKKKKLKKKEKKKKKTKKKRPMGSGPAFPGFSENLRLPTGDDVFEAVKESHRRLPRQNWFSGECPPPKR